MSMASLALYPLLCERKLVRRIWGGQRIAHWLALPEPRPANLGETWEVYDTNTVRNGHLAGQTLAEITARYGEQLIGTRPILRYGYGFPLLTKFIDANDHLSLQVHPDDEYAHTHESETGFHGKTEAWYILSAQPGANIIYGLKQALDRETFISAIQRSTFEDLVQRVPVRRGDVILVPAGTIHAINRGITLFEIQEKSDLTYRVYDYGRIDRTTGQTRDLHLEKALAVMRMTPSPAAKRMPLSLEPNNTRLLLVACSHFALEQIAVSGERAMITQSDSLEIITVLEGRGMLIWPGGMLTLKHGDSVVIPAILGAWTLRSATRTLRVLRGYVPHMERDILVPLQSLGVDQLRIGQLVSDRVH